MNGVVLFFFFAFINKFYLLEKGDETIPRKGPVEVGLHDAQEKTTVDDGRE